MQKNRCDNHKECQLEHIEIETRMVKGNKTKETLNNMITRKQQNIYIYAKQ